MQVGSSGARHTDRQTDVTLKCLSHSPVWGTDVISGQPDVQQPLATTRQATESSADNFTSKQQNNENLNYNTFKGARLSFVIKSNFVIIGPLPLYKSSATTVDFDCTFAFALQSEWADAVTTDDG